MEYIIIIAVGLILLAVKGIYNKKRNREKLNDKVRRNFGTVPEEEYSEEKFASIKHYYNSLRDKSGNVDDITWNDLSMDEIYMLLNQTCSAMGEEYLYALLRKPVTEPEELAERARLIEFFDQHEEERVALQYGLSVMGKFKRLSVHEYINRTNSIEEYDKVGQYMMMFGLLAGLLLIPFYTPVGIGVTLIMVCVNVLQYSTTKAKIEPYISLFAYIVRLLGQTKEIYQLDIKEIEEYTAKLKKNTKDFNRFKKNSYLICSGDGMSGGFMDIILDYVRMLFHIDLIKFISMLHIIKKRKNELNEIFETIGYLDSMIAIASFRKLMETWCKPELSQSGKKPFLITDEIYHPLIDEPVVNTIHTRKPVLITGSNASGKSTFIKTLAINAILAQTTFTVLAKSYKASYFRIFSSMALQDNLSGNESYYIVEIKSLKRILDQSRESNVPVLCFVDEVLRGTNTVERIAASAHILHCFAQSDVLAFAATHDLELTHILESEFDNYHFKETIEEDDIVFDYKLHAGRAVSKNAIKLLSLLGYDVKITEQATLMANTFIETGVWTNIE